jgi:hypothetical protein
MQFYSHFSVNNLNQDIFLLSLNFELFTFEILLIHFCFWELSIHVLEPEG